MLYQFGARSRDVAMSLTDGLHIVTKIFMLPAKADASASEMLSCDVLVLAWSSRRTELYRITAPMPSA